MFSPTNENGEPSGNFSFAFLKDSDGITKRYLSVEYNPVDSIADIGQITKLSFKENALKEIAIKAINKKTGARGLRSILESILLKNRSQLIRLPQIICAKNYLSIETINQLKKEIGVIN